MQLRMKLKDFVLWIANIALLITSIVSMISSNNYISENWAKAGFYLSTIGIVINAVTIVELKIRLSDFRIPFMVLTYIFMYGRIWLHYLEMDSDIFWVLHKFFTYSNLQFTSLYVVSCIQALFIGMFIKESFVREGTLQTIDSGNKDIDVPGIMSTGYILLAIGIPCRLITDINSIISTAATGNYNSITVQTGLVDDFAHLFIPGILCIMESKPQIRKPLFFLISAYYVAIMSVTGDRRYYVAGILALGAYYLSTRENKIRPLRTFGFIAVGVIFLNFLQVVRVMRLGNLGTVGSFITNYGADLFVIDDLLYDTLAEFGISFYSVVNIITNVPEYLPYQYGLTLLRCVPSILPIGSFFGDFFAKASPSTLINKYTGYPVGATIFGDLYANFSEFGIAFCILLGVMVYSIFEKRIRSEHPLKVVCYYTSYYILINMVRCTFFEMFRAYIWCLYIPIAIFSLVTQSKHRKAL